MFSSLCCCSWLKSCTTWDVKNPVNNGMTYQPQLVSRISAINSMKSWSLMSFIHRCIGTCHSQGRSRSWFSLSSIHSTSQTLGWSTSDYLGGATWRRVNSKLLSWSEFWVTRFQGPHLKLQDKITSRLPRVLIDFIWFVVVVVVVVVVVIVVVFFGLSHWSFWGGLLDMHGRDLVNRISTQRWWYLIYLPRWEFQTKKIAHLYSQQAVGSMLLVLWCFQ